MLRDKSRTFSDYFSEGYLHGPNYKRLMDICKPSLVIIVRCKIADIFSDECDEIIEAI